MVLYRRMFRKLIYLLLFANLISPTPVQAQPDNADEATFWKAFSDSSWSVVNTIAYSFDHHSGYPALWRAAGYASLMQGKYLLSADYYRRALNLNRYDTLSMITLAWNLNQADEELMAGSAVRRLNLSQRRRYNFHTLQFLKSVEFEASFKLPDIAERSTANFLKVTTQTLLSPNFLWSNSFSSFNQDVQISYLIPSPPRKPGDPPSQGPVTAYEDLSIRQNQFYSSLRFAPTHSAEFNLPFNLLSTSGGTNKYRGFSYGILAAYRLRSIKIAGGAQFLNFNDTGFVQPSICITHYPKYHPGFYYGYKSSFISSSSGNEWINSVFAGGRLGNLLWMEGFFLKGKFRNLLDQEGAYVYNTFDSGLWRAGIQARLQTKGLFQPSFSFTLDRFSSYGSGINYFLKSLTTTIRWKH
jgi:hypothetical protein